ncbi:hypothetical protein STAQ_31570 [Allostella sp. ATCC 35155]|nr:hypothetical protein STAQ_31570 [Stella sp. ATCC 35155]
MPVPLIAWGAAAAAAALAGGAWAWLFGRGAGEVPDACRARVRIWVAGPTGAGKTSLVAAALGRAVPDVSPATAALAWQWRDELPLALADTVGLELARGARQVEGVRRLLRRMPASALPHAAWLCVRADAHRVFSGEGGSEAALAAALRAARVPAIGVLTQAEPGEEAAMADAFRRAVPDLAAVVPLCVRPRIAADGSVLVERHGLDRLRAATIRAVSPVVAERLEREWPPYGW